MDYEVREPPKEEPLTLSDTKIYLRTIAGETVEDNAAVSYTHLTLPTIRLV